LFSFSDSSAQEPPVKWGEIPMADLQMKSFPQDTNATALILCDYGESYFDNNLDIIYKRHLRVKILTSKGYKWASHSVSLFKENNTESIRDIEGMTYRLDENGNVIKNELNENDIFEEKINDKWTRCRFTLPALQPGCVIEMRYTIRTSNPIMMREWAFQHDEPVRWSEYRVRFPKRISYSGILQGYEQFAVKENEEVTQVFSSTAQSFLGTSIAKCCQWRWAVKDAPAIREEPFITTTEDYVNKVKMQLAGYARPEGMIEKVLNDWPALVKELLERRDYFGRVDDTRKVGKLAEKITGEIESPEDKLKAIYDWLRYSVIWSGEERLFPEQDPDDLLESKKGSNADITVLLLSLLKSVGIKGEPVILSTRENGRALDLYPIISQFNYVIARVTLDSKSFLLDATDPYRPMSLLPEKVLDTKGLVLDNEGHKWIDVKADRTSMDNSLAVLSVLEDGSVSGSLQKVLTDYNLLNLRQKLGGKKEIEIARSKFDTDRSGISIDSAAFSYKEDPSLSVTIKSSFSSNSYAQKNGETIYINPQVIDRIWQNPFKSEIRKFPVDYGYKRKISTTIIINLPNGFELKEKPKDISVYGGKKDFLFTRLSELQGNTLTLKSSIEIKSTQMDPGLYEPLKDFYAKIVSAESEQVVLSRIKTPALSGGSQTPPKTEPTEKR
jgi:transglutaminase-like putative cysteine protease